MYELKTKVTDASVSEFLNGVDDPQKREDAFRLVDLFAEVTGYEPKMWGPSIVGFGKYHYKYDSGHEGDMCASGFSPRKQNLSLYILAGFDRCEELLGQLGKYKNGKSCLYIKRLSDVDEQILRQLVGDSLEWMKKHYTVEG